MNKLITTLQKYGVKHPEQQDTVLRFLDLIAQHGEACLMRDCMDGHIVGSLFVTNPEKNKVLLMEHLKSGRWQQFGGHADGDSDIRATALREFQEEAGVDIKPTFWSNEIFNIDIHDIPAHGNEGVHRHFDIRYAAMIPEDTVFYPEEGKVGRIEWVPFESVEEYNDQPHFSQVVRSIDKT